VVGGTHVCGDASRMAKDVDQTLCAIARRHGGLDAKKATTCPTARSRQTLRQGCVLTMGGDDLSKRRRTFVMGGPQTQLCQWRQYLSGRVFRWNSRNTRQRGAVSYTSRRPLPSWVAGVLMRLRHRPLRQFAARTAPQHPTAVKGSYASLRITPSSTSCVGA
jgi:hypothetical protein